MGQWRWLSTADKDSKFLGLIFKIVKFRKPLLRRYNRILFFQ